MADAERVWGAPSVMDPPPKAVAVLPYGDLTTQRGIIVDRSPGTLQVIVPPIRGWRMFLTWHWVVAAILAIRILAAFQDGEFWIVDISLLTVLLSYTLFTIWRQRVFLITPDEVRVGMVRGAGFIWRQQWPRKTIGEFKVNVSNGKLLIRIIGSDFKEYRISSNRVVTQSVADILQEGLNTPPSPEPK